MNKQQAGFTLIELVMVIVILGILAATAIPKYIDLTNESRDAALKGVAGAISSASAINYATRSGFATKGVQTTGLTCSTAAAALLQGGVPTGYSLDGTNIVSAGVSYTCTVTPTVAGSLATFDSIIIGVN